MGLLKVTQSDSSANLAYIEMVVFAADGAFNEGELQARCSCVFWGVQLGGAIALPASPHLPTYPSCPLSPPLPAPQKTAISLSFSKDISIVTARVSCETSIMGLILLCDRKHTNEMTPSNITPKPILLKHTPLHSSNSACPSIPVQHTLCQKLYCRH